MGTLNGVNSAGGRVAMGAETQWITANEGNVGSAAMYTVARSVMRSRVQGCGVFIWVAGLSLASVWGSWCPHCEHERI
jgi:hypothetical protein